MNLTTDQTFPSLEEMKDILDIEEIITSPWKDIATKILIGLILVILLVLLFILFKKYKAYRQNKSLQSLSPDQKALQAIEKLDTLNLLEKGDFRRYYFLLSEIFRAYINNRFSYPALDKTTPEIISELSQLQLSPTLQEIAESFLLAADNPKFAGFIPSVETAEGHKDLVIRFINETTSQLI